MILLMIFSLLVSGLKESQQTNTTETETLVTFNQTLVLSPDVNTTFGFLEDELTLLKDNQTSVITEDEEGFINQDDFIHECQQRALSISYQICEKDFYHEMMQLGSDKWCHLESINGAYSVMSNCVEMLSTYLGCFYPNADAQNFFIHIHSHYFQNCTKENWVLEDAPHWVVLVLTLIPVSLIPVLVYLVVWKSKVQE